MQTVFKRYELKYMLTKQQKQQLLQHMKPYMSLDQYGRTKIRNLYFDTPDYRLIRRSIDKPSYKEKLRIRGYGMSMPDGPVFVELKKKCRGVVYKRRLCMNADAAMQWLCDGSAPPVDSQIAKEVAYFLKFYGALRPAAFLSYEREAYYAKDGSDFRVTFDDQILCRQDDLSIYADSGGMRILPEDRCLMEIKCSGGIPMWMAVFLSEQRIYKTSFSKYGTAYQMLIYPHIHKETMDYGNTFQGII